MRATYSLASLLLAICTACTPLLDADFDGLAEGSLNDEIVALPGAPNGDRMIVKNLAQVGDTTDSGDRALWIFRNVNTSVEGNHSEVYFDPIDADGSESIYFTWNGTIAGFTSPGADESVVALKLRDLANVDQPNLFSKLIIRFGPQKITAAAPPGNEVSIGSGVTGSHAVILRIDPGPKTYSFFIGGEGVSPNGGFTHNGTLPSGTTIDPENIGLTITFADEIDASGSSYIVNNVVISQRAQ